MAEPTPSPDKRRRTLLVAFAVLVGAIILLIAVERASVVEKDPAPATPPTGN